MARAFRGMRLHIGLFGRRNVGKSSLLNAVTRQQVSIVSAQAGTTTDPVEKPMELLPLGPVLFIDTAGIDDVGALGALRVQKTRQVFERTDLGVLVAEAAEWGEYEEQILAELAARGVPAIAAFTKVDLARPPAAVKARLAGAGVPCVETSVVDGAGMLELRQLLLDRAPSEFVDSPKILADLVGPGELAVLVVPIDKEAPKGRLIAPQVQSIRELLDNEAWCVVVREGELERALAALKEPPRLVVTDSQAFAEVAAKTPPAVPLTGFSVLFSRLKGDLAAQVEGALAADRLAPGDRVLVAEACTHHPIGEDIGRVKIPRWLEAHVGGALAFDTVQGNDFPEDLRAYQLVIHCGACMLNRRAVLSRILRCREQGVPITNYGLIIAHSLGMLDRALGPFPEALALFRARSGRPA
jgi:[FeFe] hydrogenase H-cluster maturation GTPase HydF